MQTTDLLKETVPRKLAAVDRRFALLQLCFLLSGFSALLYQTAWTREFAFVFGTSEIAIAAVLAGYMGGLALGSAVAARIAPRIERPLRVYGVLEFLIALSALAIPFGMKALTAAYVVVFGEVELAAPGALATVFRLAGAFALMLVPTGLMGATLPLLARHAVRREEQVGPRIGALYAINTAGAIAGTLCAAFLLLPAIGLRQTVYVGALINGVVFLAAAALARGTPAPPAASLRPSASAHRWILPLILLSGAVSFSYEVLWTRLLSQLLGGSVYAFATMLSSFLLGISLGSAAGGRLARRPERAALGFALCQLGIAALALAAFLLADLLPSLAASLGAGGRASPIANAPLAVVVLLPVACCIGATFPFAVRILAPDPAGTARTAAQVYSWNTVGAIIGAIGSGFVLLPQLHFAGTVVVACATSLGIAAATCLLSRPRLRGPLVAAVVGGLLLGLFPPGSPWRLLRSTPLTQVGSTDEIRFHAVGRSSTVLLLERPGDFQLFTNGLPEATIQKPAGIPGRGKEAHWLGFLPVLLRPEAERMLVIGLGGGRVVEGVPPSVQVVDVVELEEEVVEANREIASERAIDPLANPRTRIVMNDARGALLLSKRRYDAIVSQPSHPWTAGASHLYTREFFELTRDRLKEDGIFVQWIGVRFIDEALLRSLLATLSSVYAEVQVYRPVGQALLFAASNAPLQITSGERAIAASPDHFRRNGVLAIEDVAASLLLDTAGARALAAGGVQNTDDRNLLASRSARLGDRTLKPAVLARLAAAHDPLPALAERLDPVYLVRSLVRKSDLERARALAEPFSELEREIALGWVAGAARKRGDAERHFRRALQLDPGSLEAHAGIAVHGLDDMPSDAMPEVVAMIRRASEFETERDWSALEALDGDLERLDRRSPLLETATRLRAAWRVGSGDAARAAQALALLDERAARQDGPSVQLARVRAAKLAGRPDAAWIALHAAAKQLHRFPQPRVLRRQALALSHKLPDHTLKPAVLAALGVTPGSARAAQRP